MACNLRMFWSAAARTVVLLALFTAAIALSRQPAVAQGEVNIYSYREPQLIDPLLKAFTDKTGIRTNVVYAPSGLNTRIPAESPNRLANLTRKPGVGDREQARDIYSRKCDIAVGNPYYMALMATNEKNPEQKQWGAAIKPLFPNANDRGSHVNISGMALARNAPNKTNALKLMDYLASEPAQKIYAAANNEYPVNPAVEPSEIVKSWGKLKADGLPLENIAKYRKRASELVDKV